MPLDFAKIKEIKLTDVCGRYKIALKFRGDYANAQCPLPTHKDGDKGKSFSICLGGNYWCCFSKSCNKAAGGKGGDCINFVALMEKCSQKDAAQKLADWYEVGKEKAAPRMEARPETKPQTNIQNAISERSTSSDSVKYMASVDAWYDEVSVRLPDESAEEHRKRILKGLKAKLLESYRAGKSA